MTAVLFSTLKGAPIAVLLLSAPTDQGRQCIFTVAAHDAATFDGQEAQVLLPDRPTEYQCKLTASAKETRVEFENQNGWHFVVRLDGKNKGRWSASKALQALSGLATGL